MNICFFMKQLQFSVLNVDFRTNRGSYIETAVGYVSVQRRKELCIIEVSVCPEHKIKNKNYSVSIVINEKEEKLQKMECRDCIASAGG